MPIETHFWSCIELFMAAYNKHIAEAGPKFLKSIFVVSPASKPQ